MIVLGNYAKVRLLRLKLPYLRKCVLHLYRERYRPLGTSTLADFAECNFAGYGVRSLSTFGEPYLNKYGQGQTDTCVLTWTYPGAGIENDIYGYYVTDENGLFTFADLLRDRPFRIGNANRQFTLVVSFLEETLFN